MNDIKLQEGHPVDENLRPIKVGGKSTAIETAQHGNGARVNGDLGVTDNINCDNLSMTGTLTSSDLTIDDAGDITLSPSTDNLSHGVILLNSSGNAAGKIYTSMTKTIYMGDADVTNHGIELQSSGTGDIELDSSGDIIIDSSDGNFIMGKAGTEFSAANSAYAGMILGYTVIGLDETPNVFAVTDAMLPTHDDHKVSFVFPPSGKVEIFASIYVDTNSGRPLTFGLSTTNSTSGFASLGAKYENHTFVGDETDGSQHTHRWYVTGTAGDSEELWFAAGTTSTGSRYHLRWGGDSSAIADGSEPFEYQPFVMKATALPATIYTG